MSRIAARFAELRLEDRSALIPYVTAGDPHPSVTVPLLHDLVAAGADLLELGVPFSDPMADGPVIQLACERALANGTGLRHVLGMVREFRTRDADTPVILMGYLNPIERMGVEVFVGEAAKAGVDGVLVVDLPPEESRDLGQHLDAAGLDPIFLVAPTTTDARLQDVAAAARGFIYYVSLKGVTGASTLDAALLGERMQTIRGFTDLPVGVGFGIRDAETAAAVARVADAVVVGSAIVRLVVEHPDAPDAFRAAASALVQDMREAMDTARAHSAGAAV